MTRPSFKLASDCGLPIADCGLIDEQIRNRQSEIHNSRGCELGEMVTGKRGLALAMVIMAALLAAIAVYAMLLVATSQAKQGRFNVDRSRGRYAAEAGLVWAQQQLLKDPYWPPSNNPNPFTTIDGLRVDITILACGVTPPVRCPSRKLAAKVTY